MVKPGHDMEVTARRCLRTGRIGAVDPQVLASACDRLVRSETQKSLPSALALAKQFVALCRSHSEMPLQIALRALGWACHCSGRYRNAEAAYLEARSLVVRSPFDRAQIDKILIDVFMYLGRPSQAKRRAERAIATFRKLGELDQVAKTRINLGNLLHRQDRHREARRQYDAARLYLERGSGHELVLGLCYYNLANTLVQLFRFDDARTFYEQARGNFLSNSHELFATECDYGLAWLAMLRNDYHIALRLLHQCEEKYDRAGQVKGVLLCVLDRAEAYLALNLFTDALDASRHAERRARALQVHYEAGKAAFFRARAAHALGRRTEVASALQRARREFAREGNRSFETAVRLFEAQVDTGRRSPARLRQIRSRLADHQLPLWAAINDLQLLTGGLDDDPARRRLSRNPAVQAVPYLRAHWQTLQGDREFRRGAVDAAIAHWTRAAQVLDLVRAKLPPVELRSTFVRGRTDPYERMIAQLVRDHPERATAWIDRLKTVGVWAASGDLFTAAARRSAAEESLSRLAQQVSSLAEQIRPISGTRSGDLLASHPSLRRMQREAGDRLAMLEQGRPNLEVWLDRLQADFATVSRAYPIVQFCLQKDDLIALVHDRGEVHSHRYHGARRLLQEWSGAWQVQLSRSLLSGTGCSRRDLDDERRLFTALGDYFWSPLEIGHERRTVLIIPDGQLSNLPWSAFIHGGDSLIAGSGLIVAPSFQHHLHARALPVSTGERIGVFVGDRANLAPAGLELSALQQAGVEIEMFDPCRRADWPSDGEWKMWHFTGHARYRADNPFYSSLALCDGPLFGADFRLKHCRVGLVTLAACRTAHQSVAPGEEATGLVRCLLEMGSCNVVGSHWAVSDRSAAVWMNHYYRAILGGHPVREAVRTASLSTKEEYPSVYDWASFSAYGAG